MPSLFKRTAKQDEACDLLGGPAKHIMLYGGSRSGKTFVLVRAIILRALQVAGSRHLMVRFRFNHAKQSIWYDTFPKVMAICFPDTPYVDNKSDWYIKFDNGSEIWLGGLDEKERTEKILGNEYATIYFNEVSQISYDAVLTALTRLAQKTRARNKAYYDCNPPNKRHWAYKMFIERMNPESLVPIPEDSVASMLMNPTDNAENLPADYISGILDNLPHKKRARFRDGIFVDDNERALWTRAIVDPHRIKREQVPTLQKVYVAIDPAVTAKESSDDTGIVIVGRGRALPGMKRQEADHFYVLDDYTMKGSPLEWAQAAVLGYKQYKADRIVGETNNGGDLVEANLRNVDKTISYLGVHASRGKMVRAEPVAALYEQGLVHHVGEFPELEDEMCNHEFTPQEDSPNRLDALVWAISAMMTAPPIPAPRPPVFTDKTRSKVRNLPL